MNNNIEEITPEELMQSYETEGREVQDEEMEEK